MITGATETCFKFLQQNLTVPDNTALDYNPHRLSKTNKPTRILWAHYAHDQPIYLNTNWHQIDHIVCVSNWQSQQFQRYFHLPKHQITVIPNGVADYFKPSTKTKTLIYASAPYRGLRYLEYIFKNVLQQHPDCKLKIFTGMSLHGQPDTEEYLQLYQSLARLYNVTVSEPIPHEQLAREMSTAQILCYPNIWEETSCVTLLEAMASGCYPVVTDIGALPETAQNYGTLVAMRGVNTSSGWCPSKSTLDDFCHQVIVSLNKYDRAQCDSMSIDIRRQHSWQTIATRWQKLFNRFYQGTYMTTTKSIASLAAQAGETIVQDPEVLERVFNEVFKWEQQDREHAQGRSNFQIEKFIALDNFTVPSAFHAMLKNRRILAEGLFSKITEMKEHQREFDYKWQQADRSRPLEWFTKEGGKKLCWYDLDYLNLQNFLKSSELEIRDRIQQLEFFDKILNRLIELNGGPITREQFEEQDHVYWERRFANQAMDEMLSKTTGISIGNIHSMRRASAPTLVSDDVNRVKNPFPELNAALAGGGGQLEFMMQLQDKVIAGIEAVTGESVDSTRNTTPEIEQRLDRMHAALEKPQPAPAATSPKNLFNQASVVRN